MPTLLPFSLTLIVGPTWCTKYATSRRFTWNAKSRPSSSNEPGTHASHEPGTHASHEPGTHSSHEPGTHTSYEPGANAPYEPAKDEPRTGSPDESRPNGSTASSTDAGTRHVVIHDLANNASSHYIFICLSGPTTCSLNARASTWRNAREFAACRDEFYRISHSVLFLIVFFTFCRVDPCRHHLCQTKDLTHPLRHHRLVVNNTHLVLHLVHRQCKCIG